MLLKVTLALCLLTNISATPSLEYKFVRSTYDSDKVNKWRELENGEIAYKFYFKGACCDMPVVENMRAEMISDTVYIDAAIPAHENHEEIGVCGVAVDFIINKSATSDYNRLIFSLKKKK